jgi:Secretion system C-terminal sorting domain/PKD-like domain
MKSIKLTLIICLLYISNIGVFGQTINVGQNNPINTRLQCYYSFTGGTGIDFNYWLAPINCKVVGDVFGPFLYLKWQNVEASSFKSDIKAQYMNYLNQTIQITASVGPFTLSLPTPTFVGGTTKNIPCYLIDPVTISLNSYINTEENGIDKNLEITSNFEWTLPSGWQTSTGQTGTFVSSSSISIVPPTSNSAVSIKVRAKANTQYSTIATLQITRNLDAFNVEGSPTIVCNTTNRYTVPFGAGVSYLWQLPTGWAGVSTTNYIDVIPKGTTGTISCTMTGCNQSKVSTPKTITVNAVNAGTVISGSATVCTSGATFTINNIPLMNSILWTCGPNLTIVSGQNTTSCIFKSISNGSSWIKAKLVTECGQIVNLSQINVWSGIPTVSPLISLANFDGSTYNSVCNSQNYSTNMDIQPTSSIVQWTRIAANPETTTWYQSGNNINSYFFYVNQTAVYRISATNSCGCTSYDFGFKSIDCGGCNAVYAVSPNPASSSFTIVPNIPAPCNIATTLAKTATTKSSPSGFISVFDQQGNLKKKVKYSYNTEVGIDVSGLKNGIYLVQIYDGISTDQKTIVVNH